MADALTRNSSLMKYFALVTRGSSPGSGVARRGERGYSDLVSLILWQSFRWGAFKDEWITYNDQDGNWLFWHHVIYLLVNRYTL